MRKYLSPPNITISEKVLKYKLNMLQRRDTDNTSMNKHLHQSLLVLLVAWQNCQKCKTEDVSSAFYLACTGSYWSLLYSRTQKHVHNMPHSHQHFFFYLGAFYLKFRGFSILPKDNQKVGGLIPGCSSLHPKHPWESLMQKRVCVNEGCCIKRSQSSGRVENHLFSLSDSHQPMATT